MLNAASKLKAEKDWMKYETARKWHKRIRKIRENYREDWKSKEMKMRQRAVALYFIDKVSPSHPQLVHLSLIAIQWQTHWLRTRHWS